MPYKTPFYGRSSDVIGCPQEQRTNRLAGHASFGLAHNGAMTNVARRENSTSFTVTPLVSDPAISAFRVNPRIDKLQPAKDYRIGALQIPANRR
jgi:hypothetical protein